MVWATQNKQSGGYREWHICAWKVMGNYFLSHRWSPFPPFPQPILPKSFREVPFTIRSSSCPFPSPAAHIVLLRAELKFCWATIMAVPLRLCSYQRGEFWPVTWAMFLSRILLLPHWNSRESFPFRNMFFHVWFLFPRPAASYFTRMVLFQPGSLSYISSSQNRQLGVPKVKCLLSWTFPKI